MQTRVQAIPAQSIKQNQGEQQATQAVAEQQSPFEDARAHIVQYKSLQNAMSGSRDQQQLHTMQSKMNGSSLVQGMQTLQAHMASGERVAQEEMLQSGYGNEAAQPGSISEIPESNKTGLPDNLKSGIESLSGLNMNHVKVHYNSDKPAQLQAHAYAQGSEIYIAPGQEQHLPHEAWHVVQQAQGRVKPTVQMKGGESINDDVTLESEADQMGARALMVTPVPLQPKYALTTSSPVQRKIFIDSTKKDEEEVYSHLTGKSVDVKNVYTEEMNSKPKKVQDLAIKKNASETDFGDALKIKNRIKDWDDAPLDYKYTESDTDAKEIAKDTIKYYLYTKFKWLNIGVGAYMTGDVTGLLMATSLKDNVSLEILKGKKDKDEVDKEWTAPESYSHLDKDIYDTSTTNILGVPAKELMLHMREAVARKKGKTVKTPNFYVPGASEGESVLPDTFKHKNLSSKLVESDIDQDDAYQGTRDAYKKKFDEYNPDQKPRPWDKETYEATRIIGELYPTKKKEIEAMLLPEAGSEDAQAKIERYRTTKFGSRHVILMWGRLSGLAGGAHTELDSHPITMVQIAQKIATDFPSRTIVLIGDKVVSESILRKAGIRSEIIDINAFWNDAFFSDNNVPMGDRRYQHFLIQQMSTKNDAVSIGMRSGSLEATALLGVKTIFLDDKGNNAETRMEFWAGDSANTRAATIGNDDWEKHEKDGPVKNYKRVATSNKTGDKLHTGKMETILETLALMKTKYTEKNDDEADSKAPRTKAQVDKFVVKIDGYTEINTMAGDLAVHYKNVANVDSIRTGKDTSEDVLLKLATFELIKSKIEKKLENLTALGIGLSSNELQQISGLTSHMIKKTQKLGELEALDPEAMHKEWRTLLPSFKNYIRDEVYRESSSYPKISKHIFHRKPSPGLGGYAQR